MLYLLDTADLAAIERCVDLYPLAGVTTNPSIIAKERKPWREVLTSIRKITGDKLMLHAQVMSAKAETMIEEAKILRDLVGANLYVKVPVTPQGMKAIRALVADGYAVTATAVLTPQQALMAAVAGASFTAPYVNRIDNICGGGVRTTAEIVSLFETHGLSAKVLAASFKNVQQVHEVALAGAQSVTVGPDVFERLLDHPLTDSGVAQFVADWESVYGPNATLLGAPS